MPEDRIPDAIARAVISREPFAIRFEHFCNDLVGDALEQGATILSTSRSWDLGRDGRARTPAGQIYTCSSLTDDVENKSLEDIQKLSSNSKTIHRVYFCSSQDVSEHRAARIEATLLEHLPDQANAVVLGLEQLAELAATHPKHLRRHYRAEVEDCVAALASSRVDGDRDFIGLRLALQTTGHDDSEQIREALYIGALLELLSDGISRTIAECCKDLADRFRLNRTLPAETISAHLSTLHSAEDVELAEHRYVLSSKGRTRLDASDVEAADSLLQGRSLFRTALQSELGASLSDDHFERIWRVVQQKISHLFYTQGQRMVEFVSRLVPEHEDGEHSEKEKNVFTPFFLDDLAEAIAATTSLDTQRVELRQATIDIFTEPSQSIFQWLAQLSFSFLAICSLGLEATCGREVSRLLGRMQLVLDTDVLISLLCTGEDAHEAVLSIVERWRRLGGRILMAAPVLEETAYHAWIAEKDYKEVSHWIPGTEQERHRYIENAFVRAFATELAGHRARSGDWRRFMRQFRGQGEHDYTNVAAILRQEWSMEVLTELTSSEQALENEVWEYLQQNIHNNIRKRTEREIELDKAKRDARLYVSMIRQLSLLLANDPESSCFLVSSARRLTAVENRFKKLGEPQIVVQISGVLYLLSLVPGVSVGLSAMQTILFEERPIRFTDSLERMLIRVVRDTPEYQLGWARRTSLVREFRTRLIENARRAGAHGPDRKIARVAVSRVVQGEDVQRTAELLRESLNAIAADTTTEEENRKLRGRVAELEKQLELMKRK